MRGSRSDLHVSKLDEFKAWLKAQGWAEVRVRGEYEVLRMHKKKEGRMKSSYLIVHKRLEVKEHLEDAIQQSGHETD